MVPGRLLLKSFGLKVLPSFFNKLLVVVHISAHRLIIKHVDFLQNLLEVLIKVARPVQLRTQQFH